MSVRILPVDTPATTIEDLLYRSTDGTVRWVAVELFDHPDTREVQEHPGAGVIAAWLTVGPWVVGPEEEVYGWLAEHDHEDYSEQYAAP